MNKKESILNSALKLLVENGIHATPMSVIARSANTGMGTIYNYFENKEALINAIYVDIKQKEEVVLSTFLIDQPIKTQFEHYYKSLISFYFRKPLYFRFMEQLQASPIITDESKKIGYNTIESVVQLLEKGQQERIIKNININELLQFLGGAILSYLKWYLSDGEQDMTKSVNNQLQMVWDAIKE